MRAGLLEGHFFLFFKFFGWAERNMGSWFPDQRSKPHPLAVAEQSLNHWTTREVPGGPFLNLGVIYMNLYLIIIALHTLCTSLSMYYIRKFKVFKIWETSPVVQWLRICLSILGTWIPSPLQKDPMCQGAAKPMCHNYWACVLNPVLNTSCCNKKSARLN